MPPKGKRNPKRQRRTKHKKEEEEEEEAAEKREPITPPQTQPQPPRVTGQSPAQPARRQTKQEELSNQASAIISKALGMEEARVTAAPRRPRDAATLSRMLEEVKEILKLFLDGSDMIDICISLKDPSNPSSVLLTQKLTTNKHLVVERIGILTNEMHELRMALERSLAERKRQAPPPPLLPQPPTKSGRLDARSARGRQAPPKEDKPGGKADEARKEILRGLDRQMQEAILNNVVEDGNGRSSVSWEDIGGLEEVKRSLYEAVIMPSLNPGLFSGLRAPPKGMLLFGPPGNGKTMIAKAVAHESKATFFNISASALTSKWVGDGEKMVRTLFALARYLQPSIIFIDEVDSILTERSSGENDAMRRLKTEFLIQFDGVGSTNGERIFVLGATNRPQDLDEAARRRFTKRIYVPLPDKGTRKSIVTSLLSKNTHSLTKTQLGKVADMTEGYSAADLSALCKEAAMIPLREISISDVATFSEDNVRPIGLGDIKSALSQIRPSVSKESLALFERWNADFGSTN